MWIYQASILIMCRGKYFFVYLVVSYYNAVIVIDNKTNN